MSDLNRIIAISEGLCYQTVCVAKDVTPDENNRWNTTSGTSLGWQISTDTHFARGQPNPCSCDKEPDRMHYLRSC